MNRKDFTGIIERPNFIHQQSSDISQGVDRDGAGDQGIMFGYAVNETEELMPAPIHYSHLILKSLADARHDKVETLWDQTPSLNLP